MKNYFLCCIIFCAFAACAPKEKEIPKEILPINEMKVIVWDMIQAGAYADYLKEKDTTIKTLNTTYLTKVLKLHNIVKEDFFKSFNFYQAHPILNKELFDSVTAYAQRGKVDMYRRKQ